MHGNAKKMILQNRYKKTQVNSFFKLHPVIYQTYTHNSQPFYKCILQNEYVGELFGCI